MNLMNLMNLRELSRINPLHRHSFAFMAAMKLRMIRSDALHVRSNGLQKSKRERLGEN